MKENSEGMSIRKMKAIQTVIGKEVDKMMPKIEKAWALVQIDINRMHRQNFVNPSVWTDWELVEMLEEEIKKGEKE